MKIKTSLPMAAPGRPGVSSRLPIAHRLAYPAPIVNRKSQIVNRLGFTLIELLTVIAIMAVLAAMIFPALAAVKRQQYLKVARAEMEQISGALDQYKARYGVYPEGNGQTPNFYLVGTNAMYSPLYYELSGVTNNGSYFVTLDGAASIKVTDVQSAFGVGGFINCTKNGDAEGGRAQNFLPTIRANQINPNVTNNGVKTTILVTSVHPDATYQPLGAPDLNPFRYVYPGVNNPNSYDLWVELKIAGKTNLVCNWTKQIPINSPWP